MRTSVHCGLSSDFVPGQPPPTSVCQILAGQVGRMEKIFEKRMIPHKE